jgi:flagellar basal-body rod protein FlgB
MGFDGLFADQTTTILTKSLDASGLRHRVIADNIANVETPGFTRSEVSFEEKLRQATLSGGDSASERLESITPEITPDRQSPARADGNNVSIEKEIAGMAKNSLEYESLVQLMNMKTSMLRTAITEGKR